MKSALILVSTLFSLTAFADEAALVKTSSKSPNPAFPVKVAEIKKIDNWVRAAGLDVAGRLSTYACEGTSADSFSCVFHHDLPRSYDYYGDFVLKYKREGSKVEISHEWEREITE